MRRFVHSVALQRLMILLRVRIKESAESVKLPADSFYAVSV